MLDTAFTAEDDSDEDEYAFDAEPDAEVDGMAAKLNASAELPALRAGGLLELTYESLLASPLQRMHVAPRPARHVHALERRGAHVYVVRI